jgi:hypothetical protein
MTSTRIADAHRVEHTGHTARIHQIQLERTDPSGPVPTLTHRLMTVRRLAADRLADIGHAAQGVYQRPAVSHSAGGQPR